MRRAYRHRRKQAHPVPTPFKLPMKKILNSRESPVPSGLLPNLVLSRVSEGRNLALGIESQNTAMALEPSGSSL